MNISALIAAALAGTMMLLLHGSEALAAVVRLPKGVHSQVKYAAARLADYLGTLPDVPVDGEVVLAISEDSVPSAYGDVGKLHQ